MTQIEFTEQQRVVLEIRHSTVLLTQLIKWPPVS